ncbi:MAG: hypothetical protein QME81_04115 [bacterium]|nr:hypothetical protein [bacterium]
MKKMATTVLKKEPYLKLTVNQTATAISMLTPPEREALLQVVPELERAIRFRKLEDIRKKNADIPLEQVESDVAEAVAAVR